MIYNNRNHDSQPHTRQYECDNDSYVTNGQLHEWLAAVK